LHGVSFEIETDHHPLRYLDTQPQLSKQQIRWLDALAEFDFKFRYVRGKYNLVADALSRMHGSTKKSLYTVKMARIGRKVQQKLPMSMT
jgi:hypothetical protein